MVKIELKLMKQLEVALFRNMFSKTILPDFTLTHLCVHRICYVTEYMNIFHW